MMWNKVFLAPLLFCLGMLSATAYGGNEAEGGLIIGQYRPTYATELKGTPELPAAALLKGAYAAFVKKSVSIGGQVIFASTSNTDNTQGSQYSFVNATVNFGGQWTLGHVFDIDASLGIGLGQMMFANASATTPLSLQASYLAAQPQLTFGLLLTQNFKLSLGGAYQYGYVYDVVQSGPSANFLEKATDKVKVGGIAVMIQFALIQ